MGGSTSSPFVDMEKGAVESDDAAAATQDALTVGMFLGGLLLAVDFTTLVCAGPRAALVVLILFVPVILLVMWDVRRTGPYRDEDVDRVIIDDPAAPSSTSGRNKLF